MKKSILVLFLLIAAVFTLSNFTTQPDSAQPFHTEEELEALLQTPIGPGEYYQPSESCRGCHGYDTLMLANVDENGEDVNLFDRWSSSMMAFSAIDPMWRAKVSHESLVNPAHSNALQTTCTSCHAPMGHYTAIYGGATTYTIADLVNDTLGIDGVSCAGCHTIGPDVGSTFSGVIPVDTTRQIYGPFPGPFMGPMQLYEGYTPVYSPHMDESSVCSPCHTLLTDAVDLNGNYTGGEFIEQATYHEYLNSSYPANNIKCQTCHMPQHADPIIIANGYINLTGRTPFNQHTFAGANYFMLDLIKNNKTALNVNVNDDHLDSSLAATLNMLQQQSVEFELFNDSITPDTAYYRVEILNKAGHKFPSGYPSRRAILQFFITDALNDTVFRSGIFDGDYRVTGESSQFTPHQNIINQDNVSQIYEMVMGDVNGQYTTVLERAAILLKDNRIPPLGFTTTASMYDTVQITNDALNDPDFNKVNAVEGSGTDQIHFHIPVNGITGSIQVNARLYYQSIPPKFLDEMFSMSSGPIDTFETMYQSSNKEPILVASDSMSNILTSNIELNYNQFTVSISPTISQTGIFTVYSEHRNAIEIIDVFNSTGQKIISQKAIKNSSSHTINISNTGIFYVRIRNGNKSKTYKVLRLQ